MNCGGAFDSLQPSDSPPLHIDMFLSLTIRYETERDAAGTFMTMSWCWLAAAVLAVPSDRWESLGNGNILFASRPSVLGKQTF